MAFTTKLELHGSTATGIQVPASEVEALGTAKRAAVKVTLNGYTYRSSVAPRGGVYMIPVSAEIRTNAGVKAGDTVEVSLELDTEPRVISVPNDFQSALDAAPDLKAKFDKLAYSHKLQHVLAIEGAKTAETRQRRIEKALDILRDSK